MGLPYFLLSVCGAAGHLAWQLRTVNYSSRRSCMAKFVSNKWLGALVFAGIVVDRALGSRAPEREHPKQAAPLERPPRSVG